MCALGDISGTMCMAKDQVYVSGRVYKVCQVCVFVCLLFSALTIEPLKIGT